MFMKKVFVSIFECRPGVQIAEDIYNDYGVLIAVENMILDENTIKRIENLGITRVKVYENNDDMITVSGTELFRAQYEENVEKIKGILHDISIGKDIGPDRVNQATDSIIFRINENRDIVNCVNDMRDSEEYLYAHSVNVSLLSMLIGKWLKYDYKRLKSLVTSAFLHDIGKVKIAQEILNKPGRLTENEYDEVKKHASYGFKIVEHMPGMNEDILKGILMHHEREDGSGYPFGLKGQQIHPFAKIIAVADMYDAMTSNKAYRRMICPFDVVESIERDYFGILDHRVVSVFLHNIASYYIGNFVKLSNGDIGEIIYINQNNVSKPIIKSNNEFIDLTVKKDIRIVELI
jgi:HD-GYP domain-containing protein (c-di-GMP phosphodiesterase class II)